MNVFPLSSVRRAILVSCFLVLAFVVSYVPWRVPTVKSWIYFPRGYHWVWSQPDTKSDELGVMKARSVDLPRVGLEALAVASIGGAAFLLFGAPNSAR